MNSSIRRGLADLACRALQAILPQSLRSWGSAVRYETAEILDDTKALLFAVDSLCGLLPRAIAIHLSTVFASLTGGRAPALGESIAMSLYSGVARRPRLLGIICAGGAVALGLAYMAIAGAPTRYLAINGGALLVGVALLLLSERGSRENADWSGGLIAAMSAALLATTLFGQSADGATRWLMLGGLAVQPSLILLPMMVVAFARSCSSLGAAGLVVAAAVLALQPDRAMAGMLAAGLAVLAMVRADRRVLAALSASIAGFVATLLRADTLPASPFVDQILYSAFDVHALAGIAVMTGALLLVVPAIIGGIHDAARRGVYLVFGVAWLAAILAAALGNYPTPVVGYGGSAIIGYVLSLAGLPRRATTRSQADAQAGAAADAHSRDHHLRLELA